MVFHFLGVLTVIGKKNSRDLLQRIEEKLVEITEGTTKILVPKNLSMRKFRQRNLPFSILLQN